jgi:glycosyltransferase involved in cell wall biosynthesis
LVDSLRVLYDGWSTLYQPNGPACAHLLAILSQIPKEIEPVLALPGPAPGWLPEVETRIQPAKNTTWGHLTWEQRILPKLGADSRAGLLHLMSPQPPLFGRPTSVISPCGFRADGFSPGRPPRPAGLAARLRAALAQGGLTRARALLWPADLPPLNVPQPVASLPPVVHPDFSFRSEKNGSSRSDETTALDLPETYVLYHGPCDPQDLQRLMAAWSWAAGPIGEYYPLVIVGLDGAGRENLAQLAGEYDLAGTVRPLPELSPQLIPRLYQGCSALFHPAPVSPWGGPVRQALASGKPIVAAENRLAAGMVGPGAYLVPGNDARALGAALITTIVEEQVAEKLSQAARGRADSWRSAEFGRQLWTVYQNLTA